MAFLLAMVLACVGGARVGVQNGDLGATADSGLVGAFAVRAEPDLLPAGKPVNEAAAQGSEESKGEDDSKLLASSIARPQIETQWLAGLAVHEVDATSTMRAWLLSASLGARGPPVG